MSENALRIAFVVQRYGLEVNGGSELHCRWVAEHLTRYGEIHVITTCAQDYFTWENVYRPGSEELNGVQVHRFPVDHPRHWQRFQRINNGILSQPHSYLDEIEWMRQQGPVSGDLLRYIEQQRAEFDYFIFFTYLYFPTYFGLQIVPEKALLVPTAHEEPTLFLSLFRSLFHLPRHIIYNTYAEQELVQRVFNNVHVSSSVVGTGINVPDNVEGGRFRQKYGIPDKFLLYIGRVDESKNCPELIEYFVRYKESCSEDLTLVLIGRASMEIPKGPDIMPLGFVSEQDKFDAIQASTAVVIPSRYESLSMVMMEAWLLGKPVLANGQCRVLKDQLLRSNGGLWYESFDELQMALNTLLKNPHLRVCLGRQGLHFVETHYSWCIIEDKYLRIVRDLARKMGSPTGRQNYE